MKILAIETSCDETAISLLEITENDPVVSFSILGNVTHSQIDAHREFGGVFPMLAKREHQKNLVPVLLSVLNEEPLENKTVKSIPEINTILEKESELLNQFNTYILSMTKPDIDAICVTNGPGLEPALWVGISFAKALGTLWNVPVVPINHMEGHILSVLVPETELISPPNLGGVANSSRLSESEAEGRGGTFSVQKDFLQLPALALLISGGHTELVLVKDFGIYEVIGKTRDDAVGEAFDKVARILGLPYPGGPEVAKLALQHDKTSFSEIVLPRPMIHSKDYDFSFSGLKTAVLYLSKELEQKYNGTIPEDVKSAIAYEFQESVAEVMVKKVTTAIRNFDVQTLIVGGGVSANHRIRELLQEKISEIVPLEQIHFPVRELTGDNAIMIAIAGYFKYKKSPNDFQKFETIRALGNLHL